jgi:hypothetical protein
MELGSFRDDFSATISRTDKVQPALLVVAILSTIAFALAADSSATGFAWAGAVGFSVTLVASVTVLVPLQRQMIEGGIGQRSDAEAMRARWFQGHLGRSVLSMAWAWTPSTSSTAPPLPFSFLRFATTSASATPPHWPSRRRP